LLLLPVIGFLEHFYSLYLALVAVDVADVVVDGKSEVIR
jgi:hypothetical protein